MPNRSEAFTRMEQGFRAAWLPACGTVCACKPGSFGRADNNMSPTSRPTAAIACEQPADTLQFSLIAYTAKEKFAPRDPCSAQQEKQAVIF